MHASVLKIIILTAKPAQAVERMEVQILVSSSVLVKVTHTPDPAVTSALRALAVMAINAQTVASTV
jgi:hypothetical protein